MKCLVIARELYPFYEVDTIAECSKWRESECEEIDDKTLARWSKVMAEFHAVQKEMELKA